MLVNKGYFKSRLDKFSIINYIFYWLGVTAKFESKFTTKEGETLTDSKEDAMTMTAFVPERSKISVSITSQEYTVNLPYTAWIEKVYYDGTRAKKFSKGIFDGVDMREYMIQYGKIESLEGRLNDDEKDKG